MKKSWFAKPLYSLTGFLLGSAGLWFLSLNIIAHASPAEPQTTPSSAVLSSSTIRFQQPEDAPDLNAIFAEANSYRVQKGLKPLRPNLELAKVANERAQDMASRNYYAHKNPEGQYYYDRLPGVGFDNKNFSCENLDLQFTVATDRYINDWLGSQKGHRECMLDSRLTDVGYAVAASQQLAGNQTAYIVVAIHGDWE